MSLAAPLVLAVKVMALHLLLSGLLTATQEVLLWTNQSLKTLMGARHYAR